MRDKTFYKEKAESIKSDVLDIMKRGEVFNMDDPFNSYPGIYEAFREFIHIVYSFDKNLPLNKELESFGTLKSGNLLFKFERKDFSFAISQIDFFLHYLETYVD